MKKFIPKLWDLHTKRIKLEEELSKLDEEIFSIEDSICMALDAELIIKHMGFVLQASPGPKVDLFTVEEWEKLHGE